MHLPRLAPSNTFLPRLTALTEPSAVSPREVLTSLIPSTVQPRCQAASRCHHHSCHLSTAARHNQRSRPIRHSCLHHTICPTSTMSNNNNNNHNNNNNRNNNNNLLHLFLNHQHLDHQTTPPRKIWRAFLAHSLHYMILTAVLAPKITLSLLLHLLIVLCLI